MNVSPLSTEVLRTECIRLWYRGYDTLAIAKATGTREATVYSFLSAWRSQRRFRSA